MGDIPLDVYQLPDGSCKLYAVSVTNAVDKPTNDLLRFLNGKSLQALSHRDYNLSHIEKVEVEGQNGFIKLIPVQLATSYWLYRALKENLKAQTIAQACMNESIERRADMAFALKHSERDEAWHNEQDAINKLENLIVKMPTSQIRVDTAQQPSTLSELSFDPDAPPIWKLVAEISAEVPKEEWKKLPTDLARRFDYYQKQGHEQD